MLLREKQSLSIKEVHVERGFSELIGIRGHSCYKIWNEISKTGKEFIKEKVKSIQAGNEDNLDLNIQAIEEKELKLTGHDVAVFQGYGFFNQDPRVIKEAY